MIPRFGFYFKELKVTRERIVNAMSQKDALKESIEELEKRRAEQLNYLQQNGLL